ASTPASRTHWRSSALSPVAPRRAPRLRKASRACASRSAPDSSHRSPAPCWLHCCRRLRPRVPAHRPSGSRRRGMRSTPRPALRSSDTAPRRLCAGGPTTSSASQRCTGTSCRHTETLPTPWPCPLLVFQVFGRELLEQSARASGQIRCAQRHHLIAAALQCGSDNLGLVEAPRVEYIRIREPVG